MSMGPLHLPEKAKPHGSWVEQFERKEFYLANLHKKLSSYERLGGRRSQGGPGGGRGHLRKYLEGAGPLLCLAMYVYIRILLHGS